MSILLSYIALMKNHIKKLLKHQINKRLKQSIVLIITLFYIYDLYEYNVL